MAAADNFADQATVSWPDAPAFGMLGATFPELDCQSLLQPNIITRYCRQRDIVEKTVCRNVQKLQQLLISHGGKTTIQNVWERLSKARTEVQTLSQLITEANVSETERIDVICWQGTMMEAIEGVEDDFTEYMEKQNSDAIGKLKLEPKEMPRPIPPSSSVDHVSNPTSVSFPVYGKPKKTNAGYETPLCGVFDRDGDVDDNSTAERPLVRKPVFKLRQTHADIKSPIQQLLEARNPVPDAVERTTKRERGGDLKHFFAGLAKPKLKQFNGEKDAFPDWRSQFEIFVDKADVPVRHKMMMLKQSLTGHPLTLIANLGYTDNQYKMALTKLDQRYGGDKRLLQRYLDSLISMPPIDEDDVNGLENLANKLCDTVAKLVDQGRDHELEGVSTLYTVVMQKVPDSLLVQYRDSHVGEDGLATFTDWLYRQVIFRLDAAETTRNSSQKKAGKGKPTSRSHATIETRDKPQSTSNQERSNSTPTPSRKDCPVCHADHNVTHCRNWLALSVDNRWKTAKEKKLCFRCLQGFHRGRFCSQQTKCGVDGCVRTHHQQLHSTVGSTPTDPATPEKLHNNFCVTEEGKVLPSRVALRMVPVYIGGPAGKKLMVNAFLDEGSDSSYVRGDIARALGLPLEETGLRISTLVNSETEIASGLAALTLESLDGTTQRKIGARTIDVMCPDLKIPDWKRYGKGWNHLRGIKFPRLPGRKTVDLLIGADHPELTLALEEKVGSPGEPVARRTPLGWTCIGPLLPGLSERASEICNSNYLQIRSEWELDESLKSLWNMDVLTPVIKEPLTLEETIAETKAKDSLRFIGDRYELAIPWIDDRPMLPPSREYAEKRLLNLERSLAKRPSIAERYKEAMQANINKGYLVKVEPAKIASSSDEWYLPHFPVIREDKETTKIRIVFDSAAKVEGVSLNDKMLPGPNLQNEIFDILVRFRLKAVAIIGDIKEMFPQVALAAQDQAFHRILWRELDKSKPIDTYQAARLTFGDKASPFLAQFVVRQHAMKHKSEYPTAVQICCETIYMDDVIDSEDTIQDAIDVRRDLQKMLSTAGFQIRRWCSNELAVLEDIPEEDRATGVNLSSLELPNVKTLGLKWNATTDSFKISFNGEKPASYTKRTLLSKAATVFDPLQLLAPFVIRAKMLLQEAWIQGLGWDEEFPCKLKLATRSWYEELPMVEKIDIPRQYFPGKTSSLELHTFTDASDLAYAASCYLRSRSDDNDVRVTLVAAKARVSPIKSVSIPRLELMGAVLGHRLAMKVSAILKIPKDRLQYWTDSMDVVHWIHGQTRRYKPFVAHRVAEIQTYSNPSQWRHIPGKLNPADLATRGMSIEDLSQPENPWFRGPQFLYGGEESWPKTTGIPELDYSEQALKEMKDTVEKQIACSTHTWDPASEIIEIDRYSSLHRIVRVTAWILRLRNKFRARQQGVKPNSTQSAEQLTVSEIEEAEIFLIRRVQAIEFATTLQALKSEQKNHPDPLKSLSPFLDDRGVLRVGGRLQQSRLAYETCHPIILPKNHHLSRLVVRKYHIDGRHARGVNAVLADTRQKYWIVRGRELVKKVAYDCFRCRLRNQKAAVQVMAPLPSLRCTLPVRAFARCGVDFGGPFVTKITRRVTSKRYLCLFTCLTTRAVHLEMAYSLETSGFLNALSRMIARRGKPEIMVSDNGTNFVGANRELTELVRQLDFNEIERDATNRGIEWRFNPPSGSHHGGVFEVMIKLAKKALNAILGNVGITDEELLTAIVEVEGLLNSRPLTYCSSDPKDEPVLTPNHFLEGQCGGQLAPRIADSLAYNLRNRWRFVQDLVSQFWKRWLKEYLSSLQQRAKWQQEKDDLQPDDVVLICESNSPRGKWPLGRILEIYPGKDGHVRTVRVVTSGKEFIRPITKLCPIITRKQVAA